MRERGDSLRTIADALTASETPTCGSDAVKWSDSGVEKLLARDPALGWDLGRFWGLGRTSTAGLAYFASKLAPSAGG